MPPSLGRVTPQAGDGEPWHPVGVLSELPGLLRELGREPWDFLVRYGITPERLAQPATCLPMRQLAAIVEAAAVLTGRESLGLLLGQRASMDDAGPLKLLVYNAQTLGEALASLVRYAPLWYRGIHFHLVREQGFACFVLRAEGDFPGHHQALSAYLAATVKHIEALLGRPWRPAQVHFACRRPASAAEYERYFRAPVLFNQLRYALYFPEAQLELGREGADRQLAAFLRQYLEQLQGREPVDFAARVRRAIPDLLLGGRCSVARVAELFGVHRVTLHRHLKDQGTSFEALLNESRRELAIQLLHNSDLPVSDIAAALGYGSSGSFVRAFARWFDTTPGAWRRSEG